MLLLVSELFAEFQEHVGNQYSWNLICDGEDSLVLQILHCTFQLKDSRPCVTLEFILLGEGAVCRLCWILLMLLITNYTGLNFRSERLCLIITPLICMELLFRDRILWLVAMPRVSRLSVC